MARCKREIESLRTQTESLRRETKNLEAKIEQQSKEMLTTAMINAKSMIQEKMEKLSDNFMQYVKNSEMHKQKKMLELENALPEIIEDLSNKIYNFLAFNNIKQNKK